MLPDLAIPPLDGALGARVKEVIDGKTKPPGSLGRIEALALRLALAQGTGRPAVDPARLVIAAADHGLVAEGISAWPQEVTAQMVGNFLAGGAAANVFARSVGAQVQIVDAGVAAPLAETPALRRAGLRRGTRNAAVEDALTDAEVEAALRFGAGLAAEAAAEGVRIVLLGEMGIGNSSAAALVAHLTSGLDLAELTGPGAGVGEGGLTAKRAVLERVAVRHRPPLPGTRALAAVGGLEMAVLAGLAIGAASRRLVVLVDGFIATAAVLAVHQARPEVIDFCIFAHRSAEPGHRLMLHHLGADPLLDLDLRLGEGTGALLALPLLRAAAAMLAEMASFADAGISAR